LSFIFLNFSSILSDVLIKFDNFCFFYSEGIFQDIQKKIDKTKDKNENQKEQYQIKCENHDYNLVEYLNNYILCVKCIAPGTINKWRSSHYFGLPEWNLSGIHPLAKKKTNVDETGIEPKTLAHLMRQCDSDYVKDETKVNQLFSENNRFSFDLHVSHKKNISSDKVIYIKLESFMQDPLFNRL
jgi:hypothetical protein